jgi:hypothetical protein
MALTGSCGQLLGAGRDCLDGRQAHDPLSAAASKSALDAARAAATGRTREQIREIYQAELCARDLPVPPDRVLDAYGEVIAAKDVSLLSAARLLIGLDRELAEMSDNLFSGPGEG